MLESIWGVGRDSGADDQGAYMSLQFNGTQAWIYGSLWLNHGAFSGMSQLPFPPLSMRDTADVSADAQL